VDTAGRLTVRAIPARAAAPFLAVLLVWLLPSATLAARLWTFTGSPLVASVGVPLTVTLNVQNIGGNGGGDEITCVQVDVPSSFAVSAAAIVSVKGQTSATVHRWQATMAPVGSVTRVTFKNPTDDNALVGLPAGDAAVFRITGTASGAGLLTFTGHAFDKPGSGGNPTCGSGTFPTIGITLSVALPTLPSPTPAPTPQPTPPPTPKPTPTATPTPTPTPTRSPTPTPSPSLPLPTLPLPTLPLPTLPLPTLPLPTLPLATVAPRPTPSGRPTPTPAASTPAPRTSPSASATPSAEPGSPGSDPSAVPPGPASGGPGSGSAGQGNGAGGTSGGSNAEPATFSVRGAGASGAAVTVTGVDLAGFDDIDWAVPALTLTVPGLLLMLAVLAQLSASAVWLPFVRRWLGTFGFTRRRRSG
jgi:hypothetical protein